MLRKVFSLFIIYCFWIYVPAVMAQSGGTQISKEAKHAEKIKNSVFKSAVGPGNDIEVKLFNKTKIRGYVSEVTDDYFAVTDPNSGAKTTLKYSEVEKVKLWLPAQNALKRPFRSSGQIMKNLAIGFGLTVAFIGVFCMASRRCEN